MISYNTDDGVWTEEVTEDTYFGDVLRDTRRLDSTEHLNDDITTNNYFSIVADGYAMQNHYAIRYVRWNGIVWKVTNVTVEHPRLLLNVGGVYNGPTQGPS